MTPEELQAIIQQAIVADRQSRSLGVKLKNIGGTLKSVVAYFFDWHVVVGIIIGVLISFAVAGKVPSIPHWSIGNWFPPIVQKQNQKPTITSIANDAFRLPTSDRKFPLIVTAAEEAKKPETLEQRRLEWVMMTSSLRQNERWLPIAEAIDRLLLENRYSPDYFDVIITTFDTR